MVMDQTSESKKVDVSSTFIENIFRSGLTLVSSNDIITIKIDKKKIKNVKNHKKINKHLISQINQSKQQIFQNATNFIVSLSVDIYG